jgi:undecaprenyl-diphosphatase
LFQAAALIPGISRSGYNHNGQPPGGLDRETAARFFPFLATPVICGAFVLKIPEILQAKLELSFLLGLAASMISGFAAIKILLIYLKKNDFSFIFSVSFFFCHFGASVYFFRVF